MPVLAGQNSGDGAEVGAILRTSGADITHAESGDLVVLSVHGPEEADRSLGKKGVDITQMSEIEPMTCEPIISKPFGEAVEDPGGVEVVKPRGKYCADVVQQAVSSASGPGFGQEEEHSTVSMPAVSSGLCRPREDSGSGGEGTMEGSSMMEPAVESAEAESSVKALESPAVADRVEHSDGAKESAVPQGAMDNERLELERSSVGGGEEMTEQSSPLAVGKDSFEHCETEKSAASR